MPTRVLVVQHAEKEREPGDPGLTVAGRDQAERTATHLATTEHLVAVVTSPLRRTRETAAAIAAATGTEPRVDDRIRERMNWSGRSGGLDDFLAAWKQATRDRDHQPAEGDSSRAAADRFLDCVAGLGRSHPDATVAVVSHGGVTVDALRTLCGDAAVGDAPGRLLRDGIAPCAITTLVVDPNGVEVGTWPNRDHLAPT